VTRAQIAELRAKGTPPPGGPGFAYFKGPEVALFGIAGDYPNERFNMAVSTAASDHAQNFL